MYVPQFAEQREERVWGRVDGNANWSERRADWPLCWRREREGGEGQGEAGEGALLQVTDNTKPPTLGFLFTLACCSQLMERYNIERGSPQRERSEDREEPRSHFDYRHLIPQVSIKTE